MDAQLASTSLPRSMRASLAGEWRQVCPAQRFACLVGGFITAPLVVCLGSAAARAAAAAL